MRYEVQKVANGFIIIPCYGHDGYRMLEQIYVIQGHDYMALGNLLQQLMESK